MTFAGIIAILLFLGLIIGDWYQFTTLKSWACQYGCPLAHRKNALDSQSASSIATVFQTGALALPHGIARWVADRQVIVIRPYYQLFSLRFRTAWPLKGTIDVSSDDNQLLLHLSKRIPWSSAILTLLWLLFVIGGTLTFVVLFILDGGISTVGGVFWVVGMTALGLLVLAGGLILLSFAYRLEDSRLTQVYQELLDVLTPPLKDSDKSATP
ncbi:hypothetical protein [Candidatus Nitrospira allomarina]|jgi:hypothetical protein|uniref:Uncharacterized protein n=1 Tax=Candidatus Nitrospira allomarina TaxID=3020900 RepID=A0AA96GBY9_9BACT|nr:hypothetical protein [Candidatus Nitrospira allomarina]WNM58973.1 hypothetical protein PP769_04175 [Candidatus Nitrospira allomarina]